MQSATEGVQDGENILGKFLLGAVIRVARTTVSPPFCSAIPWVSFFFRPPAALSAPLQSRLSRAAGKIVKGRGSGRDCDQSPYLSPLSG